LTHSHHLAGATEEWVARRGEPIRYGEPLRQVLRAIDPTLAKCECARGSSDAYVLAHAEGLQSARLVRSLAAKAIGGDIEAQALGGHVTARRDQRVEGVAGRRREHQICCRQAVHPIGTLGRIFDQRANGLLAAVQTTDTTQEVRKGFEISGFLYQRAAHYRRKPQDLRAGFAARGDGRRQSVDDLLKETSTGVHAVCAGRP
jgi:hypothetical protein